MSGIDNYKHADKFSAAIGIPREKLVEAFEAEREFHQKILVEPEREKRKTLYKDIYERVHVL